MFNRSVTPAHEVHIGLYSTSANHNTLRWVDDDTRSYYQPWYNNEPDNNHNRCVRLLLGQPKWADENCSNNRRSICEKRKGWYTLSKCESVSDIFFWSCHTYYLHLYFSSIFDTMLLKTQN